MSLALSAIFNSGALEFPAELQVDYVRVYQLDGQDSNVGCDPDGEIIFLRFWIRLTLYAQAILQRIISTIIPMHTRIRQGRHGLRSILRRLTTAVSLGHADSPRPPFILHRVLPAL